MVESVGSDDSEFDSVTSSQKSFLKHCPFADPDSVPRPILTEISSDGELLETDSDSTEVLGNPISSPLVRTPLLSFSSPTSLDSVKDDVFRTPPENPSLSSAADSETRVRVSEMIPKLKSQSSKPYTTPVSASPSLPIENVGVLETNRPSDSVEPLSSPSSVTADGVRVPGKHLDTDTSSPSSIGRTMVLENQPISASVGVSTSPSLGSSSASATSEIKFSESENHGGDETAIPFKEIIESLLCNSGERRDEQVSYVDILRQCGLKFPNDHQ